MAVFLVPYCPLRAATTDTWLPSPQTLLHAVLLAVLTVPYQAPSLPLPKFPSDLTSLQRTVGLTLVDARDAVTQSKGQPLTWVQFLLFENAVTFVSKPPCGNNCS